MASIRICAHACAPPRLCPVFSYAASLLRLNCHDFPHRSVALVDRLVRIGKSACVGIGDMNFAEWLPANFVRRLPRCPDGIIERVVFVRIAVGPAIDRNGLDVIPRVKASATENTIQLTANVALEGLKTGREHLHSSGPLFLARDIARTNRHILEM